MRLKREYVKGLIVTWEDKNPRSENHDDVVPGGFSHINPVLRPMAGRLFQAHYDWLYAQRELVWLVEITVVFRYPNGSVQREVREIEGCFVFRDISDFAMEQFEDAMRHGNEAHYVTTLFKIKCVALQPTKKPA